MPSNRWSRRSAGTVAARRCRQSRRRTTSRRMSTSLSERGATSGLSASRTGVSEFSCVPGAETCSLSVGLRQGIREPHHAVGLVAMGEAVRVSELVDRLGRGPLSPSSRAGGERPCRRSSPRAARGTDRPLRRVRVALDRARSLPLVCFGEPVGGGRRALEVRNRARRGRAPRARPRASPRPPRGFAACLLQCVRAA
jgi:hypothetical protein